MHRFTSPTPTSVAGSVLVTLFVDSWEIECCAPPPVLGDRTSWRALFVPAGPSDPASPLHAEHDVRARAGAGRVLVDGTVVAGWYDGHGPRPDAATVSGMLAGTAHGGGVPDDLPPVRGRVQRVRLVTERFSAVEDGRVRRLDRVPGSLTMADVRESPHRFEVPALVPGVTGTHETGVLIDVKVPLASLPADPPRS